MRVQRSTPSRSEERALKLFISYAHHVDARVEHTLAVAKRLAADGIDVRFDMFDPEPGAGWPTWMEKEIAAADLVLMMCTPPWKTRYEGRTDAYGGTGVAWEGRLIRDQAYADGNNSRFIAAVFEGDEVSVPRQFRQQPLFVLDREYDGLLAHLVARAGGRHGESRSTDAVPVLQSIEHAVMVLATDTHRSLAEQLAQRLGAVRPKSSLDVCRAALTIALGDVEPGACRRIAVAPDRCLITAGQTSPPKGARSVDPSLAPLVHAATRASRELAIRWWSRGGLDLFLAVFSAAAACVLAVLIAAGDAASCVAPVALMLASGPFMLAAVASTIPDGRLPIAHAPREWAHTLQVVRCSAALAVAPFRAREVFAMACVLMFAPLGVYLTWLWSLPHLAVGQLEPLIVAMSMSFVLAISTLATWMRGMRGAIPVSILGCAIALGLPNLERQWGALDGDWQDMARLLWPRLSAEPTEWLFVGPVAAPLVVTAATFAALASLRLVPRHIAVGRRALRASALALASTAVLATVLR